MQDLKVLINKTLNLFPHVIDISDGELGTDNGFYSKKLSTAWRRAEDKNGVVNNDVAFMIWSIFGLLHRKSRANFCNGIYNVCLNEITYQDIESEYKKVLKEAEIKSLFFDDAMKV